MLFVMYLWAVGFGTCLLEASIGRSLWAACAVYTQLLCSIVRRVRDKTWPDPRGIWAALTGRYALLAIVLFATWVGMGMLGHALEAREKEKKSRWDNDDRGRELRRRLAQLLGVTEGDLDDIAKPGDGASAEVVARRLGERLRMGNEDRRARADAEQRVKDAGRAIHDELTKLRDDFAAPARREAKDDLTTVKLGGRRFAVDDAEGLKTLMRNNAEVFAASEAKAAAAANLPRDIRDARELRVGRELAAHLFRTDPETMRRLRRRHEDDEPADTEPEPAKPRVAPGAVPVTTVRGPDGSMRVQGARVLFHGANNDESPSDSESAETASDCSSDDDEPDVDVDAALAALRDGGIKPWDPD